MLKIFTHLLGLSLQPNNHGLSIFVIVIAFICGKPKDDCVQMIKAIKQSAPGLSENAQSDHEPYFENR